jgi:cold shock CspA family protein
MSSVVENTDVTTANADTNAPLLVGQVKWFNVKAGYGFITVVSPDSEHKGKDIFVHYSALNVENALYRYLVQGEYVEFNVIKSNNDKYELHTSNVSGLYGGTIMCENRMREEQARGPRISPRPAKYEQQQHQSQPIDDDGFQPVFRRTGRTVSARG